MRCIIIDDDKVSCRVLEEFVKKTSILNYVGSFYDPVTALNETCNFNNIDLIFLDVELPQMTGIDLLSLVQQLPKVIIISSNDKYAVDAFDFNVSDFLLKPIKYARFLKAVNKANEKNSLNEQKDKNSTEGLFIKKSNGFIRLKYEEIYFIESVENYIAFQTFDNKFVIHETLKSIESKLPPNFWRVHRSYIVNINNVKMIEDNNILLALKNEIQKIPIGKVFKEQIFHKIKTLQ